MKIPGLENYNINGRLGPLGPRPETSTQTDSRGDSGSAGAAGGLGRPADLKDSEARLAALKLANEAAARPGAVRKLTREGARTLTAATADMIGELNPLDGTAAPHQRLAELRLVSPRYV